MKKIFTLFLVLLSLSLVIPAIFAQEVESGVTHLRGEGELLLRGTGRAIIKADGFLAISDDAELNIVTGEVIPLISYKGFTAYQISGIVLVTGDDTLIALKAITEVYATGDFIHMTGDGTWEEQ